jgi:RNA 3'-terminal phosphate cyclase
MVPDAVRNINQGSAGYRTEIELRHDTDALQRGAALALFADRGTVVRLGADQAGALGRRAESIGKHVASQLLEDIQTGATVDRFASDQIIAFAALAQGASRFMIHSATDHVVTSAWLAELFLDAKVSIDGQRLVIHGSGFRPTCE